MPESIRQIDTGTDTDEPPETESPQEHIPGDSLTDTTETHGELLSSRAAQISDAPSSPRLPPRMRPSRKLTV